MEEGKLEDLERRVEKLEQEMESLDRFRSRMVDAIELWLDGRG